MLLWERLTWLRITLLLRLFLHLWLSFRLVFHDLQEHIVLFQVQILTIVFKGCDRRRLSQFAHSLFSCLLWILLLSQSLRLFLLLRSRLVESWHFLGLDVRLAELLFFALLRALFL